MPELDWPDKPVVERICAPDWLDVPPGDIEEPLGCALMFTSVDEDELEPGVVARWPPVPRLISVWEDELLPDNPVDPLPLMLEPLG